MESRSVDGATLVVRSTDRPIVRSTDRPIDDDDDDEVEVEVAVEVEVEVANAIRTVARFRHDAVPHPARDASDDDRRVKD